MEKEGKGRKGMGREERWDRGMQRREKRNKNLHESCPLKLLPDSVECCGSHILKVVVVLRGNCRAKRKTRNKGRLKQRGRVKNARRGVCAFKSSVGVLSGMELDLTKQQVTALGSCVKSKSTHRDLLLVAVGTSGLPGQWLAPCLLADTQSCTDSSSVAKAANFEGGYAHESVQEPLDSAW